MTNKEVKEYIISLTRNIEGYAHYIKNISPAREVEYEKRTGESRIDWYVRKIYENTQQIQCLVEYAPLVQLEE